MKLKELSRNASNVTSRDGQPPMECVVPEISDERADDAEVPLYAHVIFGSTSIAGLCPQSPLMIPKRRGRREEILK